jgi:hypothetical protein
MDGRRIVRWTRGRDSDVVSEAADLLLRIDRLCSRAPSARSGDTLLGEMEALLAEGYAEALAKEAASRRLARRLERRVELVDQPDAAIEIRTLAREKRGLDTELAVLRDRLRVMRERFAHLRAHSSSG